MAYEYDKTVLETWKGVVIVLTGSELAEHIGRNQEPQKKLLRMNDRGRPV